MRNETYKHLEDPTRIGPLTLGQWAGLIVTLLSVIVFARFVSPLPAKPTFAISILVGFLPLTISYALDGSDIRMLPTLTGIWRWARGAKHFLPGGGEPVVGYTVAERPVEAVVRARAAEDMALARNRLEGAWDA